MSSTALSVSVTRSDAENPSISSSPLLYVGRCLQFFFVSTVDGVAEVIMCPAFLARSMRKSWISCRFGSSIVAVFGSWEVRSRGTEFESPFEDAVLTVRSAL